MVQRVLHPARRRSVAIILWLRGLIFTLLVPVVLGLLVPMQFELTAQPFRLLSYAGWLLVGTGGLFYGYCLVQFLLSGGTPAIYFTRALWFLIGREPRMLVQGGLYRVTRNPMYLGVALAVLGQALLGNSPAVAIYGVFLWLSFHAVVTLGEEPHLRARHGRSYEDYCREVPRWL